MVGLYCAARSQRGVLTTGAIQCQDTAAEGSGIVFGIAPALNITKVDLTPNLKDISAAPALKNRFFSLRNLLVIAQVTVSIALLICAGLLIRTLRNTQDTDP